MSFGPLFAGLCDDAALFPPGNATLPAAVPAHAAHKAAAYAPLVGAFVFPADRLDDLAEFLVQYPYEGELVLSLTTTTDPGSVQLALDKVAVIDKTSVAALEVAVPPKQSAHELSRVLGEIATTHPTIQVFVEVPRHDRREEILERLIDTPYAAKFRTGGIVAEAYPDEAELAAAIAAVVTTGVPFKATAGLHHAIRNTDRTTGFEQHGFVNLLAAVAALLDGADVKTVTGVLAERNGAVLSARLRRLANDDATDVRQRFLSYGTCSIAEPLADLADLALIPSTASVITEGFPS